MNEKDAIGYMRRRMEHTFNKMPYALAIRALEKQIPKKPLYSDYEDNGFDKMIATKAKCPTCGFEFEFGEWNCVDSHHCICGQEMKWGE